jgi:predicted MFS family arabinose efflux permease
MIRHLWPLTLGAFALGLDAYVLAGLLAGMAHDLGTTQALAGLGVALFTAAYAVSAPALAFVAASTSTRGALLGGLGLFTLGNLVTALAPSVTVLLAARLLAGIGAGLYSPLAASSASGMVEPIQRGGALSLVLAGLSVGTAFGVPVGLLVEDRFGWRWTIGLIVLLGVIAAAGVTGRTRRLPVMQSIAWRDRLAALRTPFTVATLGVTFWTGVASLGLYTYLAEVAAAHGLAASTYTFIWLWGLGGMTGALLIGRIIDRHLPPARATGLLLGLLAFAFVMVAWGTPMLTGAGCFLWGLAGWASVAPQQHALVSHEPRHATASIAWNASANYLGGAVGAAVGSAALSAHLTPRWLPAGAMVATIVALVIQGSKGRSVASCAR